MRNKIIQILKTYLLSDEYENFINQENQDKLSSLDDLKVVCKDENGQLIGFITDDRLIKIEYIEDNIKTTTFELNTYIKYLKNYFVESSTHKNNIQNNQWIDDLENQWRAQYNIYMHTNYSIFDKVLKELKIHRKYILGHN